MFFALLALRTIKTPREFLRTSKPIPKKFHRWPVVYYNDEEGDEEYYVIEEDPEAEGENNLKIIRRKPMRISKIVDLKKKVYTIDDPTNEDEEEEGDEEYYYVLEYDPTAEGENKFSLKKVFKKIKKGVQKVTKVVKKGVEIFKKGKQIYDVVKGFVNEDEEYSYAIEEVPEAEGENKFKFPKLDECSITRYICASIDPKACPKMPEHCKKTKQR